MPAQDLPFPAVPSLHVRAAGPADVAAIGALQLRAWRSAYAERLPAGTLDGLTADDLAGPWAAAIAAPPTPAHRVLVAVDDATVTGFAAVAPGSDPDTSGADPGNGTGELVILVVDPDALRRGHGSRLLNAAMDHLRGDGCSLAVTWILATDDALRAFLTDSGWAPDGAWRELTTDGEPLKQIRLHTALAPG